MDPPGNRTFKFITPQCMKDSSHSFFAEISSMNIGPLFPVYCRLSTSVEKHVTRGFWDCWDWDCKGLVWYIRERISMEAGTLSFVMRTSLASPWHGHCKVSMVSDCFDFVFIWTMLAFDICAPATAVMVTSKKCNSPAETFRNYAASMLGWRLRHTPSVSQCAIRQAA